jgi:hypothetical protein
MEDGLHPESRIKIPLRLFEIALVLVRIDHKGQLHCKRGAQHDVIGAVRHPRPKGD